MNYLNQHEQDTLMFLKQLREGKPIPLTHFEKWLVSLPENWWASNKIENHPIHKYMGNVDMLKLHNSMVEQNASIFSNNRTYIIRELKKPENKHLTPGAVQSWLLGNRSKVFASSPKLNAAQYRFKEPANTLHLALLEYSDQDYIAFCKVLSDLMMTECLEAQNHFIESFLTVSGKPLPTKLERFLLRPTISVDLTVADRTLSITYLIYNEAAKTLQHHEFKTPFIPRKKA